MDAEEISAIEHAIAIIRSYGDHSPATELEQYLDNYRKA